MRSVSVTSTSRANECASSGESFGWAGAPVSVMAGLVPAIHELSERIIKVQPWWVVGKDGTHLPCPTPMLDVLFALNCTYDVVECLEVNQRFQTVALREAGDGTGAMFINPSDQVVRYTHVEDAVRFVGDEIDVTA